jgi:hypothetical protein
VTGTYTETLDNFTTRPEGETTIIVDFTATVVFEGGFSGTGTSVGTEIIHPPTGDLTVDGVILCACKVNGVDEEGGELVLRFTATGLFRGLPQESSKDGEFTVSGTGVLANLHGHGTFQQRAFEGTYKVDIHFDP